MHSSRRELVADRLKETGRQCGSCSLCVLYVRALRLVANPPIAACFGRGIALLSA
jgi:hypothetical protein